jgi:nicotinamidase-related amidase
MTQRTGYRAFTIENTALVLIDHHIGTIGWAAELHPDERDQLKMWTRVITRFAASAGMPIVLTSSLETEAQGPLLPELAEIIPDAYEQRIKRVGVVDAWDDAAFVAAVHATGRTNLLMGGITTDVCLVHLHAQQQPKGSPSWHSWTCPRRARRSAPRTAAIFSPQPESR